MALRSCLSIICALLPLAAAAPVAAQRGSDLLDPPTGTFVCENAAGCTFVGTPDLRWDDGIDDAVVVRWRMPADSASAVQGAIQAVRPVQGNWVDATSVSPQPGPIEVSNGIATIATRVPLQGEDRIGLRLEQGEELPFVDRPGGSTGYFSFAPALGSTPRPPDDVAGEIELLYNADVEIDGDGDGYGDQTQDRCLGVAEVDGLCSRLDATVTIDATDLVVGEQTTATVTVFENGDVPSEKTLLEVTFPAPLQPLAAPPDCTPGAPTGLPFMLPPSLRCNLGTVHAPRVDGAPGPPATRTFSVPVRAVAPAFTSGARPGSASIIAHVRSSILRYGANFEQTPPVTVLATGRCANSWRAEPGKPLIASRAGDSITGAIGPDSIDAEAGDDCIVGNFAGNDDPGADTLRGGTGADTIAAGPGPDTVFGQDARDVLDGGPGKDHVDGGAGADRVDGDSGDDLLIGGDGADRLGGGTGRDRIDAGIDGDRVDGGPGGDRVRAGAGQDEVAGGEGGDRLDGGSGRDRLDSGPGRDLVFARDGSRDRVRCGKGRDRAVVDRRDRVSGCEIVSRPKRR